MSLGGPRILGKLGPKWSKYVPNDVPNDGWFSAKCWCFGSFMSYRVNANFQVISYLDGGTTLRISCISGICPFCAAQHICMISRQQILHAARKCEWYVMRFQLDVFLGYRRYSFKKIWNANWRVRKITVQPVKSSTVAPRSSQKEVSYRASPVPHWRLPDVAHLIIFYASGYPIPVSMRFRPVWYF